MTVIAIELPNNIPVDVAIEIAKRACYCDSRITDSRFDAEQRRLEIRCENGDGSSDVADKVRLLIDKMKTERLAVQSKVLRSRQGGSTDFDADVFRSLEGAGDVFTEGIGVISRGGTFLSLLMRVDRLLERIATDLFGAATKSYNTLIPADWLRRAGYFSSFAHSITFATHLSEDFHRIERFAARHKNGRPLHFETLDEIATPEYCLSPAVCYHTYGSMAAMTSGDTDEGLRTVTAVGRCFRYESKNLTALDRLWEFSMREIVFVGEKRHVLDARQRAVDTVWRLVEILDLHATLETASDPFFATDFRSLRFFQLANELKYELRLPVEPNRSIAAASFNYHESFFGDGFAIRTAEGAAAHTGCAAFGLERLVFAALAQIGAEALLSRLDEAEKELTR